MRRLRLLLVVATLLPAAVVASCETVYLGEPPADINACRPSQLWFIEQISPNFLFQDYGGRRCTDSTCHGDLAPNALDLTLIDTLVNPGTIPLAGPWATNYMATTEEMNCSNVGASKLLEYPAGLRVHGGGKLIEPDGPEALLIRMWISQP